ncbi:MAG: hypothetical protein ACXAE3_01320 [Candidatus Kariarchaeaceae archaeon]|jgi:hypothetical protein
MARPPVWQSSEWQEAKRKLLKDSCQQCGENEQLALVHLWKPPRYRSLLAKVELAKIENLVQSGELEPFTFDDEPRDSCPSCQSINLRRRKTKHPPFKCGRCGEEFETAVEIMVRDEYLYNKAFRDWKSKHLADFQNEIENAVNTKQEEFDKRYRSGEGTETFCKKCAFLFTQKGMILCRNCKNHYHKRRYEQCYTCNTSSLSVQVLCDKCNVVKMDPQPGDINICESCMDKMWSEMT